LNILHKYITRCKHLSSYGDTIRISVHGLSNSNCLDVFVNWLRQNISCFTTSVHNFYLWSAPCQIPYA